MCVCVFASRTRKLSQALGIDTEEMWDRTGVLEKQGQNVQALTVAKRMRIKDLGEPNVDGSPATLIDTLHRCCAFRDKGDTGGLSEYLARSGHGRNEKLWTVAQAVSEVLPDGDKEKQLLLEHFPYAGTMIVLAEYYLLTQDADILHDVALSFVASSDGFSADLERAWRMHAEVLGMRTAGEARYAHCAQTQGHLAYHMGNLQEAQEAFEAAGDGAMLRGEVYEAVTSFVYAALVAASRGRFHDAQRLGQRAALLVESPLLNERLGGRLRRGCGDTDRGARPAWEPCIPRDN